MPTPISTIELARTIAFARSYAQLRPLVGVGNNQTYPNEPALSIGDWVRQVMLSPPFAWRWNRSTTTLTFTPGNSDVTKAISDFGWMEKAVITNAGGTGVTSLPPGALKIVQVSVPATAAAGNFTLAHNLGVTPSAATITMTSNGAIWFQSPSYDSTNLYLVASDAGLTAIVTLFAANSSVPASGVINKELKVDLNLGVSSETGLPNFISSQSDDGQGNITFRTSPAPDSAYSVTVTYQKAAPIFASTSDTWLIPDYLSFVYNQGFLAKTYEQKGDERMPYATQLFYQFLVNVSEGLTDSQKNIFMSEIIHTANEMQRFNARGTVPGYGPPQQ